MTKCNIWIMLLLLSISLVSAATLEGTIYNSNLDVETNILVTINTEPEQKFLSKDGTYSFELPLGEYTLTAVKNNLTTSEIINVNNQGKFVYDLFLINSDTREEEELWAVSEENEVIDVFSTEINYWAYVILILIVIFSLGRYILMRKKYGPLNIFRKKVKIEQQKTIEQHKEDIANEPSYIKRVLDIIKKNDGRIDQKSLRKEMLDLSEAKISLILTELEHTGKIEKIKKGRGNIILFKEFNNTNQ